MQKNQYAVYCMKTFFAWVLYIKDLKSKHEKFYLLWFAKTDSRLFAIFFVGQGDKKKGPNIN